MHDPIGSRFPFKYRDPPIIGTFYGVNTGSGFREGDRTHAEATGRMWLPNRIRQEVLTRPHPLVAAVLQAMISQ